MMFGEQWWTKRAFPSIFFIKYSFFGKKCYDITYGFSLSIKFRNVFTFPMKVTVIQPVIRCEQVDIF